MADLLATPENKSLFDLHRQLIEIESLTYNEGQIGIFLASYLKNHGFTVEKNQLADSNRTNIYAYYGQERNTRVLLAAHLDTVPPFIPYKVEGDKIYGRGAADDKGPLAAQVFAVKKLHEEGSIKEGDVGLLFDVGEEKGGDGINHANKTLGIEWEAVIFGEPTDSKLIIAHKGAYRGTITARGKAGHSSRPETGVNAIEILIDTLNKLRFAKFPESEVLGKTTINIGIINGGAEANVIPPSATATFLIRVSSDLQKVKEVVEKIVSEDKRVTLEENRGLGPVHFDTLPGFDKTIFHGGTDAFGLHGKFRRYLFGPGPFEFIHSDKEHITAQELVDGVKHYQTIILHNLAQEQKK